MNLNDQHLLGVMPFIRLLGLMLVNDQAYRNAVKQLTYLEIQPMKQEDN